MRKRTQEEFINKCRQKHKGYYDYSRVVYMGALDKIEIICPQHGMFIQVADKHMRGQGCKKCIPDIITDTSRFIEVCQKVHGDKYNYEKVVYVNSKTKVCVICSKHGDFYISPRSHVEGHGCVACAVENRPPKKIEHPLQDDGTKVCKICKQAYTLDWFEKNNRSPTGCINVCRICTTLARHSLESTPENIAEIHRRILARDKKMSPEEYREYQKELRKKTRERNREKKRLSDKRYANSSVGRAKRQAYIKRNKEYLRQKYRDYAVENRAYLNKYRQTLMQNNPSFRIASVIRTRIASGIRKGYKKGRPSSMALLGITYTELKIYLESLFSEGMSWDNYGEWHIDHYVPLAYFDLTCPDELYLAWNWQNLRPMWAKDNI